MSLTGYMFEVPSDQGPTRGRVLLDVLEPIRRGVLADDSPLRFFQEAVLVQVVDPEQRPAGNALFVGREALEDGAWQMLEKSPVSPEDLDFPIAFTSRRGQVQLARGEVARAVDLPYADYLKQPTLSFFPPAILDQVAALHLGKPIPRGRSEQGLRRALARSDLRLSPEGLEVLARVSDDWEEPYHVVAARLGFPVERLLD